MSCLTSCLTTVPFVCVSIWWIKQAEKQVFPQINTCSLATESVSQYQDLWQVHKKKTPKPLCDLKVNILNTNDKFNIGNKVGKNIFCKIRDTNPGSLWIAPLVDVPEATVPLTPITTIPKFLNRERIYSGTLLTYLFIYLALCLSNWTTMPRLFKLLISWNTRGVLFRKTSSFQKRFEKFYNLLQELKKECETVSATLFRAMYYCCPCSHCLLIHTFVNQ